MKENKAKLFIAVNAINGVKAVAWEPRIYKASSRIITTRFARNGCRCRALVRETNIEVVSSNWFNPLHNYKLFYGAGNFGIIGNHGGSFFTSSNIVKEKETGTIEQINVTPIKKYQFILGKLIPFWVLGLLVLAIGFGYFSVVVYGIVSPAEVFSSFWFCCSISTGSTGFGLLISTYCNTQQQAMLFLFFNNDLYSSRRVIYSIESMPQWAQWITKVNPVSYFINVMREVVLKGSSLADVAPQIGIILLFAIVLNTWATLNYRKRS